jgi:ABC-2 type transport system permease protein
MRATLAIARREWQAPFLSPGGYVIAALYLLATGLVFMFGGVFEQGQIASMRGVVQAGTWLLLLIAPAISMRSISEELRLGTFETLATAPVSDAQIIVGKFLGGVAFLASLMGLTLVFLIALERHGRPDYGEVACGYLGMALAGAAYLSAGLLASSFTSSQIVAYLLTVFFWFTLSVGTAALPRHVPDRVAAPLFALNPELRLNDFAIGLLDSSNVVYFASLIAVFLAAAIVSLQVRRSW